MSSPVNIRDFLHDVLANKSRAKISYEEFNELLNTADQIQKFSQKGLFIVTLSQQLHKMSNVNYSSIKKFMNDFLAGLKPEKVRRQREEGEIRRRRRRPAETTHVARGISGMAEESVSHPSNLEMVRIGGEIASQESESVKVSEEVSKRSDQNRRDMQFADQLNKISEGIEYITNQELEMQHDVEMEELSKASSVSSSQSFGVVSNLSQKLDLLKRREEKPEKKTKAAQRTAARVDTTATKRKPGKKIILDENLTLEKTRGTLADTTYEERSFSFQYSPWIEHYQQQQELYEITNRDFLDRIKETPLSILNNMMLSARKEGRREMHEEIPPDLTQFDTGFGETVHDFTSQPMPDFSHPIETSFIPMSELSIFKYEEANPTLTEISIKVNKPEPVVFYEMLAKMQKGEIVMTQENLTNFSQIRVELLSQQ